MTLTRLFITMFVTLLALPVSMGNNAIAGVAVAVVILGCVLIYVAPMWIAFTRGHPQRVAIAVLSVFLGWTVLGWVAALVWACTNRSEVVSHEALPSVSPSPPVDPRARPWTDEWPDRAEVAATPSLPKTKTCPYCAEDVLAAAIRCKHCHADLSASH